MERDQHPFSIARLLQDDKPSPSLLGRNPPSTKYGQSVVFPMPSAGITMMPLSPFFAPAISRRGAVSKRRRMRTSFTDWQLLALEDAFAQSHYPAIDTRDRLALYTGLPEERIQIWFKNRRAKQRRQENCRVIKQHSDEHDVGKRVEETPAKTPDVDLLGMRPSQSSVTMVTNVQQLNTQLTRSNFLPKCVNYQVNSGDVTRQTEG